MGIHLTGALFHLARTLVHRQGALLDLLLPEQQLLPAPPFPLELTARLEQLLPGLDRGVPDQVLGLLLGDGQSRRRSASAPARRPCDSTWARWSVRRPSSQTLTAPNATIVAAAMNITVPYIPSPFKEQGVRPEKSGEAKRKGPRTRPCEQTHLNLLTTGWAPAHPHHSPQWLDQREGTSAPIKWVGSRIVSLITNRAGASLS